MLKRVAFLACCCTALIAMNEPARSQEKSPLAPRAIHTPFNMQVGTTPSTNAGNVGKATKTTVIRNFSRTKPPRAYAGSNPGTAARSQDRTSKYTQFIQMSTQTMNETQNTERELMDALQTTTRANKQKVKKQGSTPAPSKGLYGVSDIPQRSYQNK